MISLGALSALATGQWNPVLGVQTLGLGVGALILIIFATWTTNDKNLYSGGLALTNIFPSWPRWQHTLVLGTLGTAVACLRLTQYFTEWLIALGIVFAPLLGLLLTDHFIIRARHHPRFARGGGEGEYQYSGGINWASIVAIVAGVGAGRFVPPEAIQPLVSIAATGLVYVACMRLLYPSYFRSDS
jgi:cytosine permease